MEPATEEPAVRDGRVVVGVDDTPGGVAALRRAVELARSRGVSLVAVRCWALGLPRHGGRRHRHDRHHLLSLSYPDSVASNAATELVTQVFHDAVEGVPRDLAVRIETPRGDPGITLVGFASRARDVLVVGTRPGRHMAKAIHGSVSGYCSRHSSCTVVVVPPDGPGNDNGRSTVT